ncbi:unnamed protein product [Chilo suppressalis]|uniref:DUF4806 domain-containing protein n=1 Tax=Chilo suppressalis TaxID=168631 RepID=A0ABN8B7T8_CHISP|nr:unnamed protein product [Chilo suppressalis]
MAKIFETRMAEFQAELKQATASRKNSNTIAALNTEFVNFKAFVCNGLAVLRAELDSLCNRMDRIEMRFRRKMLLVHGIPEKKDEDTCATVVSTLATKCKIQSLTVDNIASSYRMGKQGNSKPRPIVVKFSDFSVRTKLWKNKAALKGSKITLSEFLTAARDKFGISNCWTQDGTIHAKTEGGGRRKVESLAYLRTIIASASTTSNTTTSNATITSCNTGTTFD